MSTSKKKQSVAETEEKVEAPAVPEISEAEGKIEASVVPEISVDAEKERRQEEQDEKFFAKLPSPCVYCGPSVRGVARQFTVYHGGIPDALKEFVKEHRAVRGLIVSVERFTQVRKNLETPGTGEYILFRKVRAEL